MKTPQGKPRELPAEGTHPGTLVSIFDLGEQPAFKAEFSPSRRIVYVFELTGPGLKQENGSPFLVRKEYTFSKKSKNLLADLKAWNSYKGKDLADYEHDDGLGRTAALTITISESGEYANISNVGGLMKGVKVTKHTMPLTSFYLDPETFTEEEFKTVPEYYRNKMAASPEYAACMEAAAGKSKKKGATAAPAKGKGKK